MRKTATMQRRCALPPGMPGMPMPPLSIAMSPLSRRSLWREGIGARPARMKMSSIRRGLPRPVSRLRFARRRWLGTQGQTDAPVPPDLPLAADYAFRSRGISGSCRMNCCATHSGGRCGWRRAGGSAPKWTRINTFCILDSTEAFPCRGLFKHLRKCNINFNRKALNPFFCGEECGGAKAAGARCE